MDLLFALLKSIGHAVSLLPLVGMAALFVAAALGRLPWLIATPVMILLVSIATYPVGVLDGVKFERLAWKAKMIEARADAEDRRREVERALEEKERQYLDQVATNEQLRQQYDDELNRILNERDAVIEAQQSQIISSKKGRFHAANKCACDPYRMRVDPRILRNIQKR